MADPEKKKKKSSTSTTTSNSNKRNKESFHEDLDKFTSSNSTIEIEGEFDVVIVGAGFAGLTAARDLAEQGFSVVVVEAR